jgi:hypothetical protein
MRTTLFIVHLVVAVGLVGADLALLVLGVAGLAGTAPGAVYPAASLVASWVIGPLVVLALGTGIVQAVVTGRGLLRERWVTVKLATAAGFTIVVWAVLVPRLAAGSAAASSGAVFPLADRLPLVVVPVAATSVLVALVGLAVAKPRLRRGGRVRG